MNELVPINLELVSGTKPPECSILRSEFFNVSNSADSWRNMADAAMAAFKTLKMRGEENISVNVNIAGGISAQGIAAKAYHRYLAVATACVQNRKPVAQLSEEEKFSICVASGVRITSGGGRNALVMKLSTANACGIIWDEEDGEYRVYEKT